MDKAKIEKVKSIVRNVPDFPIKGIQFKDLTTAFKDPEALRVICDETYELYKDKGITKVVGIESRGFIIGAALAVRLGAGFVPIRTLSRLTSVRSMAPTLSRFTRTRLSPATWFLSTTICSLPEALCLARLNLFSK